MSRRKKTEKRIIEPDAVYNNSLVAKLINQIMRRGKKTVARKIVYGAFDIVREQTKKDPIEVFEQAMRNAAPVLEVKSRRIGGASYQVPIEVRPERRISLAMRWIINSAKAKKGKPMREKLAQEIIEASQNSGAAVKKKEDTHRMAEANRAFAHFAW
ncbi:MAG: 30S ribosomal protein S7 [Candidatus Wildermuthbacteria bacterium RIFCSPHIGHO2_01_FULL_47_27]|uniref:Small ribosomal subunit protein uS7 n=2 Tax=Candidatus Wildermuthiibacteriota TaxID=1817923 RepID=A0A1G2RM72_9BACT|nr:MAG: 30S ribosomal protein S7 [Parcubacteria group bacterium GW2011_GWA2_47_9]OHA63202.1 MAG: 30S ribosomal protein S7 [Candidatus Wildermuthbacteria bacterium RIFCSPHIGHO2_01_FULL_47_27]OHA67794.1 MAG: 30S ribosomal protein S7 [Candidatus Wildermuthbacteria bacterium RIFCSPHIGHO2_02_FULL_47_17]OHA73944.1 MAG: 30S ribosomal protein S7 [Candidatus Wildermuthbacteria bacterium RIFCSPLOWO2_01_FULL_48_35]OHA74780.1 MAG: 30S ribosomal protein S7 [Candidatus Wildermuthbacteria bacterium RIFCSPLOWO